MSEELTSTSYFAAPGTCVHENRAGRLRLRRQVGRRRRRRRRPVPLEGRDRRRLAAMALGVDRRDRPVVGAGRQRLGRRDRRGRGLDRLGAGADVDQRTHGRVRRDAQLVARRVVDRRPGHLEHLGRIRDHVVARRREQVRRRHPGAHDLAALRPGRGHVVAADRANAPPVVAVRDGGRDRRARVRGLEGVLAASQHGRVEAGIGGDLELVRDRARGGLPRERRQRLELRAVRGLDQLGDRRLDRLGLRGLGEGLGGGCQRQQRKREPGGAPNGCMHDRLTIAIGGSRPITRLGETVRIRTVCLHRNGRAPRVDRDGVALGVHHDRARRRVIPPSRRRIASGFSSRRCTTRLSGRAPNAGSYALAREQVAGRVGDLERRCGARRGARRRSSCRSTIGGSRPRVSRRKMTVSSTRFRNSGRNVRRAARPRRARAGLGSSRSSRMNSEPAFEVMIRIALRKSTVRPWPSVRRPSSSTCSRTLKTSAWAFSISSSRITAYGRRRTASVSWPPSS